MQYNQSKPESAILREKHIHNATMLYVQPKIQFFKRKLEPRSYK